VLELPRSVRLAAWGSAALAGTATLTEAQRAVIGDDEPHRVDLGEDDGYEERFISLYDAMGSMRELHVPGLRVVLPAPGDTLGLPGPPEFNRIALEAGECVVSEPVTTGWTTEIPGFNPGYGLVPHVTAFGSVWEPGALVVWTEHHVLPRRLTVVGSLAEAERELREALVTATETLRRLDVARWRPDAADRIATVRDGELPRGALPPSAPPRCVRVLGTAARVRAVVELASEDDGAALTAFEIQRRARTLRELDAVCRRAMTAAVDGLRELAR
jgi:hypothetical protein